MLANYQESNPATTYSKWAMLIKIIIIILIYAPGCEHLVSTIDVFQIHKTYPNIRPDHTHTDLCMKAKVHTHIHTT